jgi:hypothetical protein
MELNNYLQQVYRDQHLVTWNVKHLGDEHQGTWLAIVISACFYAEVK